MLLKVDTREKFIIPIIKNLLEKSNINLEICNLDLGDAIIYDNDLNELIIFERKSLGDLASSIKDGRYNEQSLRLSHTNLSNHNIIYIIEGSWEAYNSRRYNVPISTLLSAMVSINYFKGFSIMRTLNLLETAELIVRYIEKINKSNRYPYYKNNTNNNNIIKDEDKMNIELNINQNQTINNENNNENDNINDNINDNNYEYVNTIKRVKKENVNIHNILAIMLSQIPNISSNSAIAVSKKYNTMKELIKVIEEKGVKAFDDVKMEGSNRRISSVCKENIVRYILGISSSKYENILEITEITN